MIKNKTSDSKWMLEGSLFDESGIKWLKINNDIIEYSNTKKISFSKDIALKSKLINISACDIVGNVFNAKLLTEELSMKDYNYKLFVICSKMTQYLWNFLNLKI